MRAIERVLALELCNGECAFAVLENTERLIEWGSRGLGSDVSAFLDRLSKLVERYRPDVLVVEDAGGSRKGERVRECLVWAEQWAVDHDLRVRPVEREAFLRYLQRISVGTKYEVAQSLTALFPELSSLLPKKRRAWESESKRLSLFVAIARGLWYYER